MMQPTARVAVRASLPLLAEIGLNRYGEIPLWNPYNNGGLPFIADTQAAVFYPPPPIAPMLPSRRDEVGGQPTEQHVVRRLVLRVEFHPHPLEILHRVRPSIL